MFSFIKTANSSHKVCFVCNLKSNYVKLYNVKKESILNTYKNHRILIKKKSRCCLKHLDDKGLIKDSEIRHIKTKMKKCPEEFNFIANQFCNIKNNIFDKFNNIDSLEDKHCLEITGWNKEIFIRFTKYITSCNNTYGRSIEQLIAIYRFWLRKGIDQTSLALYKNKTSQQQISNYLYQIRSAIYKDFVPYYLGVNKDRDFFLKHNNITVKELHDLGEEDLAVFVDATYSRLEKSANNNFQYLSWSQQKLDHLTKPFIICCADGYFIDCYGPFQANKNDATIFDYILKTDKGLLKILLPKKTYVFLDRGFRDIYKKLINDYSFVAKIPTCVQLKIDENEINDEHVENNLKKGKLTRKQANDSRLVTKCRFIIEKQNGALKNFKALDNIRNTVAGHIQIDYRIACAMCNFNHKSCCPDGGGEHSKNIAKRIKIRSNNNINPLEFLLSKQLDTKNISSIKLNDINDFVKLSKQEIIDYVLFGTYQYKKCLSYVQELIENNVAYIVSNKLFKIKDNTSKTIAVEITSRHKRAQITKLNKAKKTDKKEKIFKTTYKVFLNYEPDVTNVEKAIIDFICSCNSGRKSNGCCAHVATLIFYLSCAKHIDIKTPATHLNDIFINMEKSEKSNNPRYVKNKRSNLSVTHSLDNKNKTKLASESLNRDTKLKSSIYFDHQNNNHIYSQNNEQERPILSEFQLHIPKWGGYINYKNSNIYVSNTCTIDYYLFALWVLFKRDESLIESLPKLSNSTTIKIIIIEIENLRWNKAKELWINEVMKYNETPIRNSISMFGSEENQFLKYMYDFQKHNLFQKCNLKCQNNGKEIKKDVHHVFFKKVNGILTIYSCFADSCNLCKCEIEWDIQFTNKTNFVFIESAHNDIFIDDLPKRIVINKRSYKFQCATVHQNNHFIGIFELNNSMFAVNDIGQSMTKLENRNSNSCFNMPTTVSCYYLI